MYNLEFLRMINNGYDPLLILGKGGLGYHYDIPMVGYGLTPQQKKLVEGLTPSQAKELAQALGFEYEPEAEEEEAKVEEEESPTISEEEKKLFEQYDDVQADMTHLTFLKEEMENMTGDVINIINDKKFKTFWDFDEGYKHIDEYFERKIKEIEKKQNITEEEKETLIMELENKQKLVNNVRDKYKQQKELYDELVQNISTKPIFSEKLNKELLSKYKRAEDILDDVGKYVRFNSAYGKMETAILNTSIKKNLAAGVAFEYAATENPDIFSQLVKQPVNNIMNTKDKYPNIDSQFFVVDLVDDDTYWELKNYSFDTMDYDGVHVGGLDGAPLTKTKFEGTFQFVPYYTNIDGKYKLYNIWDKTNKNWVDDKFYRDYKAVWKTKDGFWMYDILNDKDIKFEPYKINLQRPTFNDPKNDKDDKGNQLLRIVKAPYKDYEMRKKMSDKLIPKIKLIKL